MFYSYDFHYKNPGILTDTGVLGFLRRQEARYHTAVKAVTAVNKPLHNTDSPKPATAFIIFAKILLDTTRACYQLPTILTLSVFSLRKGFTAFRFAYA
ncbi:MAG TPA: hypothetical protein DEG55_06805 [Acidaminococcaceae bacterium]|nr:hypothetical protein [Acidaminococcaceae bacterium]